MSERAKRLRILNFCIIFFGISLALFAIGVAVRVKRDWDADPLKDISDGYFSISISDQDKVLINYSCDGEFTAISYDIAARTYTFSPMPTPIKQDAAEWFSSHDKELYSLSVGIPLSITAKEVLYTWKSFHPDRLQGVRAVRNAVRNNVILYAVATFGGYFAGEYVGGLIHVGCAKPNNMAWRQNLKWQPIIQNVFNMTLLNYSQCMDELETYVMKKSEGRFWQSRKVLSHILLQDDSYPAIKELISSKNKYEVEFYGSDTPPLGEIRKAVRLRNECSSIKPDVVFTGERISAAESYLQKSDPHFFPGAREIEIE